MPVILAIHEAETKRIKEDLKNTQHKKGLAE
jgi:hypothetical protein